MDARQEDADYLWDVVEEHFDEAEFGVEQFEGALLHPYMTLRELTRSISDRLIAHLDGLVVGGDLVSQRVLVPKFEQADPQQPSNTICAALALSLAGDAERLGRGLMHPDLDVRSLVVRGCQLAGSDWLAPWAHERLRDAPVDLRSGLIEIAGSRLSASELLANLQSDDPASVAASLRVVSGRAAHEYGPVVLYLLTHDDAAVREQALFASLMLGLPSAWSHCERLAFEHDPPSGKALLYCSALGNGEQRRRVQMLLDEPSRRQSALWALGFSGDPTIVPGLLRYLDAEDPREAKLAAQAIATIVGIDLNDPSFAITEAPDDGSLVDDGESDAALPALEAEMLDVDLTPEPIDALPLPNKARFEEFWRCEQARFDPRHRFVLGRPLTVEAALDVLERAPLMVRHEFALLFRLRSGGRLTMDTRAFPARQLAQLSALRAGDWRSISRRFSEMS